MFFRKKANLSDVAKDKKIDELEKKLAKALNEIKALTERLDSYTNETKKSEHENASTPHSEQATNEHRRATVAETMGVLQSAITLRDEISISDPHTKPTRKPVSAIDRSTPNAGTNNQKNAKSSMSASDRARLKDKRVFAKIQEFRKDFDFLIENLPKLKIGYAVNPLQYYWLRANPAQLDNEFLCTEFPSLSVGDLGRDTLNGNGTQEEFKAVFEGPDFSSDEQCILALSETAKHLTRAIVDQASQKAPHKEDRPLVECCKRLLNSMDTDTLTTVLQSDAISLREEMENSILLSFAAETAHLYGRLEDKKVYLRPKFSKLHRIIYDEYGEPVKADISSPVLEMLVGIKIAHSFDQEFRLFDQVEDDLVPYAILHMRSWLVEDDSNEAPAEGLEYEKWVSDQLNKNGWIAHTTQGSGDQGVDVVAVRDGLSIGVQCKRYSGAVGNKAVQEVYAGVRHMHLDEAVVITNSGFTKSARELSSTTGTFLIDDNAIPELFDLITKSRGEPN